MQRAAVQQRRGRRLWLTHDQGHAAERGQKKPPGQMSYQDYVAGAQMRDREDLIGSSIHDVLWNAFHESRVLHNGEQCHDLGTSFQALDKDSNGRVSAQELRDAVESMDIVLTDTQINHLVGLMDIIKDQSNTPAGGVIDEWEFKQFMLDKDGRDSD